MFFSLRTPAHPASVPILVSSGYSQPSRPMGSRLLVQFLIKLVISESMSPEAFIPTLRAEVYKQRFWMRHWGHPCPKRTILWSNSPSIRVFDQGKLSAQLRRGLIKTRIEYKDRKKVLRYRGSKQLKQTGCPVRIFTCPARIKNELDLQYVVHIPSRSQDLSSKLCTESGGAAGACTDA